MSQTTVQPADQLSDTELVKRVLGGEQRLFELIIRRYNQRLYRIGMSVLNNDAETEDAMQNAYINAYEHLASFGGRAAFGTWLVKIMINECLGRKRKNERFDYGEIEKYLENKTSMNTPSGILTNKELGMALEHAISQLPEKYRLVFMMREVEELSVKETTEALGIEESNVKVRLNRAKTMLREHLNGHFKEHVYAFHLTRCDRMVANVFAHIFPDK